MTPVGQMTRVELAAYISGELHRKGIDVVLSGGSCVSIYTREEHVTTGLDFVNVGFARLDQITEVMESLGFSEHHRFFKHPETNLYVDIHPGPLGVGEEPVKQIDEMQTEVGTLRIISPTDCVKDRLTWYYHDEDMECFEQAALVIKHNKIDMKEIERWSKSEGEADEFKEIRKDLEDPT